MISSNICSKSKTFPCGLVLPVTGHTLQYSSYMVAVCKQLSLDQTSEWSTPRASIYEIRIPWHLSVCKLDHNVLLVASYHKHCLLKISSSLTDHRSQGKRVKFISGVPNCGPGLYLHHPQQSPGPLHILLPLSPQQEGEMSKIGIFHVVLAFSFSDEMC